MGRRRNTCSRARGRKGAATHRFDVVYVPATRLPEVLLLTANRWPTHRVSLSLSLSLSGVPVPLAPALSEAAAGAASVSSALALRSQRLQLADS